MNDATIVIPVSLYTRFLREVWPEDKYKGLRFGQSFHNFLGAQKITSTDNVKFFDSLYGASMVNAVRMINARLDYES